MARSQHDREDILREATALVQRIEWKLPGHAEPVIVGFRPDGAASLFFGTDPVFQFNSQQQLRRAFVAGKLIKAERGRLVALERHRTATRVELLKSELDAAAAATLLADAAERIRALGDHLRGGEFTVRGQVPESVDVAGRVRDWIARLAEPIPVAARPHAG